MHPSEVETALESLTLVIDTREQDTAQLRKRIKQANLPVERKKIDYGDYTAKLTIDENDYYLDNIVVVERKMNADELATCFTRERARFKREFERAKEAGAKTYLLVENTSWDEIIKGNYRSRMLPQAYVASLTSWLTRYDCQIIFCSSENSGYLIRELLKREAKCYLESLCD